MRKPGLKPPRYVKPKIHVNQRDGQLRSQYGLSLAQYDAMFEVQNGKCAICEKPQESLPKRLSVDHCHKSGKVRGLVCDPCNNGLSRFRDSILLLAKAIQYLSR